MRGWRAMTMPASTQYTPKRAHVTALLPSRPGASSALDVLRPPAASWGAARCSSAAEHAVSDSPRCHTI